MKRLLVGALFVALLAPQPTKAVLNGANADASDWPALVALVLSGSNDLSGQFCGGTLVGPRKVITAAHCLYDTSWEDGELVVGSMGGGALSSMDSVIGVVKSYEIHPAYDSDLILNDIGVITLEADMVGVPYAVPAADDSALVVGGAPAAATVGPPFPGAAAVASAAGLSG